MMYNTVGIQDIKNFYQPPLNLQPKRFVVKTKFGLDDHQERSYAHPVSFPVFASKMSRTGVDVR